MLYYKKCIELLNINNFTYNNIKKYIIQPYYFTIILILFLLSSVSTTLLAQFIAYQGAANEFSMFLVFIEYLGMLSVWILHDFFSKRFNEQRRRSNINNGFTPIQPRVNYDYSNELQNVVVVENENIVSDKNLVSPNNSSFGIVSDVDSVISIGNSNDDNELDEFVSDSKEYQIVNKDITLSPLKTFTPLPKPLPITDTSKITIKSLSRAYRYYFIIIII